MFRLSIVPSIFDIVTIPAGKSIPAEVASITLLDLLDYITAQTVILKLDIEGFECKVTGFLLLILCLLFS